MTTNNSRTIGRSSSGKVVATAIGSLLAFANPAGRYPVVNAQTITANAWNKTGQAISSASKQFDARRRKAT